MDLSSQHQTDGLCIAACDIRAGTFNTVPARGPDMGLERDRRCPECETVRTFYRTASTRLALGEKTKWRCPECGHGVVRIGDDIETA